MKVAQVGEAILKRPAKQVEFEEFSQAQLGEFIDELLTTMLAHNGVGIAAPQVFDPRAIMIIASKPNPRYPNAPDMEPEVLVNPQIIDKSSEKIHEWEGCLSVPGLRGRIERPDWVLVNYLNVDGHKKQAKFEGFISRIFQHEYDHLIGKTWLDHIHSSEQIMANEVWLRKFDAGEL